MSTTAPSLTMKPDIVQTRFRIKPLGPADTSRPYDGCPLCGSASFSPVANVRTSAGEDVLERSLCSGCGHVSFSRMPDESWFGRLYREEFETVTTAPVTAPQANYSAISDILAPHLPDLDAKILDLGCGYGSALGHFRSLGYHNLFGLEPSDRRAAVARNSGLKVAHCSAEDMLDDPVVADGGPFDAAYTWHAMEHVYDPRRALANVAQTLRPDGLLFVCVPNVEAEHLVQMAHYTPHIHSYSPSSLRTLLENLGFEVVYSDDSVRMVGVKRGATPHRSTSGETHDHVAQMRRKFVRDFGLRKTPVLPAQRAVLQFSDYRGSREVLEPSYGTVAPEESSPRVLRATARTQARLGAVPGAARLGRYTDRVLSRYGPLVVGDVTIAESPATVPHVSFEYQGSSVDSWFK